MRLDLARRSVFRSLGLLAITILLINLNPQAGYSDATPRLKKGTHGQKKGTHVQKKAKQTTKRLKARKNRTLSDSKSTHEREVREPMPPPGNNGEEKDDWFYRRRAFPNEEIEPNAYSNALEQARRVPLLRTASKHSTLASFNWQPVGPYTIDGRVTTIAVHPTDGNTFYVGAASGGVWKTTDHGAHWACVTDTFGTLAIGCLTIDPVDPETIYLGQGEPNNSGDSYPGNGLWKSTNGGRDWMYLGFAKSQYISRVIVDPRDHNVVYMAAPGPNAKADTNRGVYKSTDAGTTWKRSLLPRLAKSPSSTPVGIIDLAMNPLNSSQLVAFAWDHSVAGATGFSSGPSGPGTGIWRSVDSGASWTRIDTLPSYGLPNGYKDKQMSRGALLWQAAGAKTYLYTALTRADTNEVTHYKFDVNFKALYRSTDEGVTWQKTVDSTFRIPLGGIGGKDSADMMNKQGSYNLFLAANPRNAAEVYLGGIDVLRSTDYGQSFTNITNAYSEYYVKGSRDQHSDQHGLAFTASQTENDMIVVSDGGLFETKDFGARWKQMTGLPITMFYAVEAWKGGMSNTPPTVAASDLKLFGGTQDNGTVGHGFTDAPDYQWISQGDGGVAIAHPTDANKIITSQQLAGIFARNSLDSMRADPLRALDTTHDSAPRWHSLSYRLIKGPNRLTDSTESRSFIAPIVLDQQRPTDLYVGAVHVYHAVIDWTDLENTKWYRWSPIIAGSPNNASQWYYGAIEALGVGARDEAGHPMLWAGGVYNSGSGMWRTAVDPARQDTVAPRWINISKGLPGTTISSITPDRSDSLSAFITTMGSGTTDTKHILMTSDGGVTWKNISGNLPSSPVSALVIDTLNEHGDLARKNQTMMVATDVGVFATTNGGAKWYTLGEGMPHIIVSDLKIYKNMLIAATHGRSMYALDISNIEGALADVSSEPSPKEISLSIYPNPAARRSAVTITIPGKQHADACRIINVSSGISTIRRLENAEGSTVTVALGSELTAGSYILQVMSGETVLGQGHMVIQ